MEQESLVAQSPVTKDVLDILQKSAQTASPVLITGEHGVGKKTFARFLHKASGRPKESFAIYAAKDLAASEISCVCQKNFTICIEHIELLPTESQNALLMAIKNKMPSKIVAISACDIADFVDRGTFLEELFFRLNVFPVRIPPLRARTEDVFPLAELFARFYEESLALPKKDFSRDTKAVLEAYAWPGNILELKALICRAVLTADKAIQTADLHLSDNQYNKLEFFSGNAEDRSLKTCLTAFKRNYVLKILEECNWNQTKASKILDIQRTYVSKLMNELHIRQE